MWSPSKLTQINTSPRNDSATPKPSRLPAGLRPVQTGPRGSRSRICSINNRLWSTSRIRIQTRASTSPASSTGMSNLSWSYGGYFKVVPRIEGAAARTAHIAAGAVLTHQRRLYKPGAYGPILERRGVVVELHELWKRFSDFSDQRAQLC